MKCLQEGRVLYWEACSRRSTLDGVPARGRGALNRKACKRRSSLVEESSRGRSAPVEGNGKGGVCTLVEVPARRRGTLVGVHDCKREEYSTVYKQ